MEDTTVSEEKLSLKIMVDSKAKRVVFAEAQKDFVDFLFHILSLPLATVFKLLSKEEELSGSLPALYKSFESLNTRYFEKNVNKDTVLQPKLSITLPLLSFHHVPNTLPFFKCPSHDCVSDRKGESCLHVNAYGAKCYNTMTSVNFTYVKPKSNNGLPGFVNEAASFMVLDNLEVKPMSVTLIKSIVIDFDSLVEQEVHFGPKEGLALLRASMETNNVLTTVFLGTKNKTPQKTSLNYTVLKTEMS